MSYQRTRLAKYLNTRQYFKATFSQIRHDKDKHPEILFTNIYPVYADGKKVPIRDKKEDGPVDKKGRPIAADHAWVKLGVNFLRLPTEAMPGDVIMFKARVDEYPINRENVLDARQDLWLKGKQEAQRVYLKYKNQTKKEMDALWQVTQDKSQAVYEKYKQHLLTYDEMRAEQKALLSDFKKARRQAYYSMQNKQKRRINKAQKKIKETKLVDYELTNLREIKFVKLNHKFDKYRVSYNPDRIREYKYTKFLAAHSMAAANHTIKNWQDNKNKKED